MAAAARPYWKGYLKLSLVSCPVALYSAASSSERVAFRQLNGKTGNRLRQQLIDDETREPVDNADKVKGYEVAKNQYLIVQDAEIDAIAIESSQTIDIDRFVPRAQIDERYLDSPYYLAPTDRVAQEAFGVIREAMRGKGVVALGRVVLAKRERVIMLQPWEKGLLGMTLRYAYEVRDSASVFHDITEQKVEPELLKLADHIVDSKRADFDPSTFRDRFEEAMVEMLQKKQEGMPAPANQPAAAPMRNVINIMDALRRSIESEEAQARAAAPAPKAKKGRKAVPEQREMLLPIAGTGPEKAGKTKAPPNAAEPVEAKPVKTPSKRKAG